MGGCSCDSRLVPRLCLIDLSVCAGMARQLEGGHGHLAEMVQAVKNHGAGALHFTAGCKMVEVCEYLLRMSRWTWMSLTKQAHGSLREKNWRRFLLDIQKMETLGDLALLQGWQGSLKVVTTISQRWCKLPRIRVLGHCTSPPGARWWKCILSLVYKHTCHSLYVTFSARLK
ncbi:uncharacterized protein [Triticum aestivum]|uniref:uncharacterized protein isoform X9 n=1 Tax=Triticum aestivum TaxID=4565 RepID=UPI001D00F45F|nr:uncharacterized protein LOC123070819 isoform X9 [Triticum aestivum]